MVTAKMVTLEEATDVRFGSRVDGALASAF